MNEITIFVVGIGIGYFWAMYRKGNIITTVRLTGGFFDDCIDGKAEELRQLHNKLAAMRAQIKKEGYHV